MAKTKKSKPVSAQELDGVYFLKLVMYLIIGAQWLRFTDTSGQTTFALPVGLIIGMSFALHEHFKIDRKIEFAVLLIASLIGLSAYIGINVAV